jgi:hypothetical protein
MKGHNVAAAPTAKNAGPASVRKSRRVGSSAWEAKDPSLIEIAKKRQPQPSAAILRGIVPRQTIDYRYLPKCRAGVLRH